MTFLTLFIGNGTMIMLTALAAMRRREWTLMPYAILNPLYWVGHSIAAWRALYQVVVRPSHWEKTPHGIVHGPHQPVVGNAGAGAGGRGARAGLRVGSPRHDREFPLPSLVETVITVSD